MTKEQAKQPSGIRVVPRLLLVLFSAFSAPRLPQPSPGWAIVQLYVVHDPKSQSLRACWPPSWHTLSLPSPPPPEITLSASIFYGGSQNNQLFLRKDEVTGGKIKQKHKENRSKNTALIP